MSPCWDFCSFTFFEFKFQWNPVDKIFSAYFPKILMIGLPERKGRKIKNWFQLTHYIINIALSLYNLFEQAKNEFYSVQWVLGRPKQFWTDSKYLFRLTHKKVTYVGNQQERRMFYLKHNNLHIWLSKYFTKCTYILNIHCTLSRNRLSLWDRCILKYDDW